jgi:hypothetical protein
VIAAAPATTTAWPTTHSCLPLALTCQQEGTLLQQQDNAAGSDFANAVCSQLLPS